MAKGKPRKAVSKSRTRPRLVSKAEYGRRESNKDNQQRHGTVALVGHEAKAEERLGELVGWYMLQGMSERAARRRAKEQIREEPLGSGSQGS
jgi:hypothetical protein